MTTPHEIVRLKITLDDVKPTVMRRVEVPVSITLDTLHEIIQAIMPWDNSHLHAFYLRLIDGPRWAPPSPFGDDFNFGIKARDSLRTTVAEALAEPNFKALRDDWRHTIKVERRFSADLREEFPKLPARKLRRSLGICRNPRRHLGPGEQAAFRISAMARRFRSQER